MTYKNDVIVCAVIDGNISTDEVEIYLKKHEENKKTSTEYRKVLCAYDYVKFGVYDT